MSAIISTDIPPPEHHSSRRKRPEIKWEELPVGGSFEFEGVTPSAVMVGFASFLARGKYRIRKQGEGRYRFWRLG